MKLAINVARYSTQDRVILVEDVITTGKTTKELLSLVQEYNNTPLALCSIVDRSMGKIDFSHPLFSVVKVEALHGEPTAYPLYEAGMESHNLVQDFFTNDCYHMNIQEVPLKVTLLNPPTFTATYSSVKCRITRDAGKCYE